MDIGSTTPPPDGFRVHDRTSPVTEPWQPIYACDQGDRVRLGMFIDRRHTNSRGVLHGGVIAALTDNAMGLSLARTLSEHGRAATRGVVTISLSIDYLAPGNIGDWLEVDTTFVHAGGSQGVTQAFVIAGGRTVARANATFRY